MPISFEDGHENFIIGPFGYPNDQDIRILLNVSRTPDDHNTHDTAQILIQDATDDAILNSNAMGIHHELTAVAGIAIWYNAA